MRLRTEGYASHLAAQQLGPERHGEVARLIADMERFAGAGSDIDADAYLPGDTRPMDELVVSLSGTSGSSRR
ncbi:MAG: hypothetical protein ABGZ36_21820, partial [Actinomycetota bacterium]